MVFILSPFSRTNKSQLSDCDCSLCTVGEGLKWVHFIFLSSHYVVPCALLQILILLHCSSICRIPIDAIKFVVVRSRTTAVEGEHLFIRHSLKPIKLLA